MDKKLKILQIIPNLGLGGAEIMVENLSAALKDYGFTVGVVSLYDYHSAITERLENQNITVYYLGKKKGPDIGIIFRLYKLFKEEKPDVVHTHLYTTPYVIPAAIFAKVPVRVHTIHSIAKKEVGKLKRKINNFFYKYCNVIPVSISPIVRKSIIEEYKLLENQVPMIYNGIDLKRCIQKKEHCRGNGNISIVHLGSFKEAKNHLGLIESFKVVHDNAPITVLKLIGSGDLEEIIKDKVKELDLEDYVEFLGLKSNVNPYLNEADIFVLPSLWEGMPISLIEAMATGLPIVATGVGGVPDMIEDNVTGLLIDIDKEQIAGALLKLINDCNLREKMGTAAIVASERFSAQIMAEGYGRLYKSLL